MLLQTSVSSGEQTADATIHTGKCYITGVQVITDATNDATLVLKDGGSSGTVLAEIRCDAAILQTKERSWTFPMMFETSLYADITGTNASYVVEYIVL